MKKQFLFPIVLLSLTLAASAAGPKKVSIEITQPTTVAGVQLKPGEYRLQLSADSTEATFYQGSTEVVKAAVHSQDGPIKYTNTQLDRSENTLKAIQVGGTKTDIVIDGPAKAAASAGGSR